jgi:pimeloyl-ACP methyl ester carboxylesterase
MNLKPNIDILEATRLTREGRLAEALAILQGGLPSSHSSPASSNAGGNAGQRRERPAARIIDMVPPSSGGAAWTSPKFNFPNMAPDGSDGSAGGLGQSQMPEALRGFLDRMGQPGSLAGFDGLVGPVPARAPAPLPEGARFEERTFANEAGSRVYKLYIPSGYTGQPVPLVVMLHGCTQSPDDFAAGTQMNELAEEQTFLVAFPAQTQSANVSKCWNWFNAADQQRDRGEPSLIAGITRQIMRDFSVEPGRVYVAGLSAGGAAAAIMGSAYPDPSAAVGSPLAWRVGLRVTCRPRLLPCGRVGRLITVEPNSPCRPLCSMVIATRPSVPSMVTRSLLSRKRAWICDQPSAADRLWAGSAIPVRWRPMTADTRCSSIGFFTGRVMRGPAEVRVGPTPNQRAPMPAAR